MPEQLQLKSGAAMEERARGLHKVNTYKLKTHIAGAVGAAGQPAAANHRQRFAHAVWRAILMLGVGDARASARQLTLGGQTLALKPGTFHPSTAGACTPRCPNPCSAPRRPRRNAGPGTGGHRAPVHRALGSNTEVQLSGGWPHPSLPAAFYRPDRRCGTTASRRNGACRPPGHHSAARHCQGKPVCQASTRDNPNADQARPKQRRAVHLFTGPSSPWARFDWGTAPRPPRSVHRLTFGPSSV